ncbi:MAG: PLP-dependent aminotransferase family protein [Conexivisphaera sp.]|jgi:DNA-binding transcriptional MocR family regulator
MVSGWRSNLSAAASRLESSPVELAYRLVRTSDTRLINMASGNPDPKIVPVQELSEIAMEVLGALGYESLVYPDAGGLDDLKKEIRLYMAREGVSIPKNYEISVTSGAQHAFKLMSELLGGGDVHVICESPTFVETLAPLKLRSHVHGIPFSSGRLDLGRMEEALKALDPGSSVIYLIPTCHNPTGITMSEDDRHEVLELAEKYDALIIEDEPYRAFSEAQPPALVSLDNGSRVIYVGTLSKVLAPGLRIGWIAAPPEVASAVSMLENYDITTSTLTQHIALESFRHGLVDSTASALRAHYLRKRHVLEDSLSENMPPNVNWEPNGCGLFQLVSATGFDAEQHLIDAIRRGIIYVPARRFFVPEGDIGSIRLSLGPPSNEEIEEGTRILAGIISEHSSASSRGAAVANSSKIDKFK